MSVVGWEPVAAEVRAALAALADGEAVVVGTPAPAAAPAPRRWGRRSAEPAPFVQFLRMDDDLLGECSGPARAGGPLELDPATEATVTGLGWAAPDDPTLDPALARPGNFVHWWDAGGAPWPTGVDLDAVASLAVATLRAAFAATPDSVDVTPV